MSTNFILTILMIPVLFMFFVIYGINAGWADDNKK